LKRVDTALSGLFGPAAATALEDLPYDARGLLSGLFEQGYAVGYLLAAIFYRALVPTTSHGWRSLFWFGAGPPVLIIAYRLWLPETNYFLVMKAERDAEHAARKAAQGETYVKANELRAFAIKARQAIRENWFLLCYMIVLMSGFNSVSHGSQDLYPTFLKDQVGMDATNTTVVTVIGQIGALIGGATIGYISTLIGRRLTMMTACVIGGSLVPAYIFPRTLRIIAPVFFEQFFVGGVWGPIPIHLMELSPPALRSLTVGLTYQLGNLVSAASATIEATIGERYPLPPLPNGTSRYDYGRVIGIFLGAVWAYMLLFLFLGPEMTHEERAEMAEEAREFEELRRVGTNLQEIGERRAREKLVGKDEMVEDVEQPQNIEKSGQEIEHRDVV
jgi:SHS family lactate transporter-like MFS transporter